MAQHRTHCVLDSQRAALFARVLAIALGIMKRRSLIVIASLLSVQSFAQSPLADVQTSHIEANVPPEASFDALLRRDLLAYFGGTGKQTVSVEYKLLRDAPTQSGVAYPKYYLWVQVHSDSSVVTEGAVRVAAIERKRFEVTSFLSRSSIQTAPTEVSTIFPAALVSSVLSLAGVK